MWEPSVYRFREQGRIKMNEFLHKAKIVLGVFLVATMLLSIITINDTSVLADTTVRNPQDVILSDGVVLSKTAKSVDEKVNSWDVTLRVEMPWASTTSDTVIVIDKSWSMVKNGSGKMKEAKKAAKSLAEQLLPEGNTTNRVALISFEYYITVHEFGDDFFTTSYSDVASEIDGLQADGGTFTQAAIREATKLLVDSDADIKNIVLLSDGVPTSNYYIYTPDDYLVDGGPGRSEHEKQISEDVPESAFNYDLSGGAGYEMWYSYSGLEIREPSKGTSYYERHYYNSGNCAIAEARFYKEKTNGELYTVALDMNEEGNDVLSKIASPGKAYVASEGDLSAKFEQIGGRIISDVSEPAVVNDLMGDGIVVSSELTANKIKTDSIEWTPEFTYDASIDKYVAEMTYRVEANETVLKYIDDDGFAPLNKKATIAYGAGKSADFPVPMAKPIFEKATEGILESGDGYGQMDLDVTTKAPETGRNGYTGENERNYAGISIAVAIAMASVVMLAVEIVIFKQRR